MEKIDNEYIDEAVNNLVSLLGVRENIDYEQIIYLARWNKIKECVKEIAEKLGLPIEIDLTFVSEASSGVRQNGRVIVPDRNPDNQFESSSLVKTDENGDASEGISAQVLIPPNLPFYGSNRLNGYHIKVKVSYNCTEYPKTFSAVIAHEMSHVLLTTLGSQYAHNEIYTDLTPLVLGFCSLVSQGRKTAKQTSQSDVFGTTITTHTTNYGYLNDEQFEHACQKIKEILKENQMLKNKLHDLINTFEKKHLLFLRRLQSINRVIGYYLTHKSMKFKNGNFTDIIKILNSDYIVRFNEIYTKNQIRITKLRKCNSFTHYTSRNIQILQTNVQNTQKFISEVEANGKILKADTKLLLRNINLLERFKLRQLWG
jgi:hypothetical protein